MAQFSSVQALISAQTLRSFDSIRWSIDQYNDELYILAAPDGGGLGIHGRTDPDPGPEVRSLECIYMYVQRKYWIRQIQIHVHRAGVRRNSLLFNLSFYSIWYLGFNAFGTQKVYPSFRSIRSSIPYQILRRIPFMTTFVLRSLYSPIPIASRSDWSDRLANCICRKQHT